MVSSVKPLFVGKDSEGRLRIENYPNAVHLGEATGPTAEELRDMWLCRHDVSFAHRCLVLMLTIPRSTASFEEIQEALWLAAVVSYFKCFATGVRKTLRKEEVFADRPDAIPVFDYFSNLRNRHLAHDVNAFLQCLVGVVVNPEGEPQKIGDAVALPMRMVTAEDDHVSKLLTLVTATLEWLNNQVDPLFQRLCQEYEKRDYKDLLTLPPVKYTVPSPSQVDKRKA